MPKKKEQVKNTNELPEPEVVSNKPSDTKRKAVNAAIANIERAFGKGSILKRDSPQLNVDCILTGQVGLDSIMGGGFARGRIAEVFGPEGCLDGDTFIPFTVWNSKTYKRINHKGGSIKRLYERFQNEKDVSFTVSSINQGECIFHNPIADVVKTGKKECFLVKTQGGKELIATKDHKFYVGNHEFMPLEFLSIGDEVYVHNNVPNRIDNLSFKATVDTITEIIPVGLRETYDIKCYTPNNNYVANDIVVHNSGKTTLALHAVAEAQKAGGIAAFVDAEHALNADYATTLGVDMDELIIAQPDCGEQALEIARQLICSQGVAIVVVDSVAALTPRAELEGTIDDQHVGRQARMMSQFFRMANASANQSKTSVIFINQLRMKIGVMYGNPETTPGGNALKFYACHRLDLRARTSKGNSIREGDLAIGHQVHVRCIKNKIAPPFQEWDLDLIYGQGFSPFSDIIRIGVKKKVIEKSGSWYSYNGESLGQGEAKAGKAVQELQLFDEIRNRVLGVDDVSEGDDEADGVLPDGE